jgi:hypothetical protein
LPAAIPLTSPALVIVAIAAFEEVQGVVFAGVGVPLSCVLDPAQSTLLPVTTGSALMVIVEVTVQFVLFV